MRISAGNGGSRIGTAFVKQTYSFCAGVRSLAVIASTEVGLALFFVKIVAAGDFFS